MTERSLIARALRATATVVGVSSLLASPSLAAADGKATYEASCQLCHAAGVAGAPKLEDTEGWAARIEQGMDLLVEHAIKGYQGSAGYMPPKGGNMSLSDEDVKAAVEYMVEAATATQ